MLLNKVSGFWLVLGLGLGILIILTRTTPSSWGEDSRMAAAFAVSEHNSLAIDSPDNPFPTGDKAFIKGHFYSCKPPLMAFLAGLTVKGLKIIGLDFIRTPHVTVWLITLIFCGLPFLWYLSRLGLGFDRFTNPWLGLVALGGTMLLAYAFMFINHLTAAVLLGLVLLRRIQNQAHTGEALLDGLLIGLAAAFDLTALLAGGCLGLWVLGFRVKGWPARFSLLAGGLGPVAAHAALNLPLTGDLFPPQMHYEFLTFPGAHFRRGDLTGVGGPSWNNFSSWIGYLWTLTWGRKGFFLHNPLLILALLWLVKGLLNPQTLKGAGRWAGSLRTLEIRYLCLALAISIIGTIGYYSVYSNNGGGGSYSIRWFVILLPLLIPLALDLLNSAKGAGRRLAWSLAFVSLLLSLASWPNPLLPEHAWPLDMVDGYLRWPMARFTGWPMISALWADWARF